jgi:tetratricopeptide (TPR) repeat protein
MRQASYHPNGATMAGRQESMAGMTIRKATVRGARVATCILWGGLPIATAVIAAPSRATAQQAPDSSQATTGPQTAKPIVGGSPAGQQTPSASPAPKVDPKEDASYKTFYDVPPSHTDELIQLGEAFLSEYPASAYREVAYSRLAQAYVVKQNFSKMEEDGEKALALNPNDADALALLGWAIPHNYDPADPNAAARLAKSEDYSRRALQILATLPTPALMSAEQFAQLTSDRLSQAHSGLGLVYFRRRQYAQAVPEFQQAIQLASIPDPIDLFVLGESLQQLQRYDDAAAAYDQCGKVPNNFQPRCQAKSLQARQQAARQQSTANRATTNQAAAKP